MASALYDKGRNRFAKGEIAWKASGGDTIRVCLVKNTYPQDLANHEFFSDLSGYVVGDSGGTSRASCPALTLFDPVAGVCDAADVTFTTPTAANTCEAVVIFKDGGSDGASPLLAYIDSATGIPVTTSGGNVPLGWDNGSNKIFKL